MELSNEDTGEGGVESNGLDDVAIVSAIMGEEGGDEAKAEGSCSTDKGDGAR